MGFDHTRVFTSISRANFLERMPETTLRRQWETLASLEVYAPRLLCLSQTTPLLLNSLLYLGFEMRIIRRIIRIWTYDALYIVNYTFAWPCQPKRAHTTYTQLYQQIMFLTVGVGSITTALPISIQSLSLQI